MTKDARTVVITRAREDAQPFAREVQAMGAHVVVWSCIETVALPAGDVAPLPAREVAALGAVAFASRMAVTCMAERFIEQHYRVPAAASFFAVGPATATLAQETFGRPVTSAAPSDAEHLRDLLLHSLKPNSNVLLPVGRSGRRVVEEGLARAGHRPLRWELYETRVPKTPPAPAWPNEPFYVLFASPSAVHGFTARSPWPDVARAVSIGPSTSHALGHSGIPVYRQSDAHDAEGLLRTLRLCLEEQL